MNKFGRGAGRAVLAMLPAERRDWAVALWAEAGQVPSGPERLRWLTGGLRLIVTESALARRPGTTIGMAAAAVCLGWTAVRGTASGFGTGIVWFITTTTALALAGLPPLIRRRFGPVSDSRAARWLRAAVCASAVILVVAVADLDRATDIGAHAGPHNLQGWMLVPWSVFLLLLAGYVAVAITVTAQRSWVTPPTLLLGTQVGIVLGVTMYAIMPLGFGQNATAPWLPGAQIDPLVVAAWVLLVFGPLTAAVTAGWRCTGSVGELPQAEAKIRQGVVAGVLVTVVGSLVVCMLGSVTLAVLPDAGWLLHLLYPGQHLTAASAAHRVSLLDSNGAPGYFLIWLAFPIIGLAVAALTSLVAFGNESARQRGQGPGGGGGWSGSPPVPPPSGGRAGATDSAPVRPFAGAGRR